MNELSIVIEGGARSFRPGEQIRGEVRWRVERLPTAVELRLFWYTRGRGDRDVGVAESLGFDAPADVDERRFSFTAPGDPPSLSGKLISIVWALELVVSPGELSERVELVIAPDGREIVLGVAAGATR